MLRQAAALLMLLFLALPAPAPAQEATDEAPAIDRSATGGAQTLEDIMRRQQGLEVDNDFRTAADDGIAEMAPGLGPLGGASDPELWRALRFGDEALNLKVSTRDARGRVIMQDGGMWWYDFRQGPLLKYGGWLLLGTIGLLALFFLLRGRVRIDGEKAGRTVTRFKFVERAAHWLLAGSFILLGLTGILTLMGRKFIAPYLGKDLNADLLVVSKLIHNNVAWAFMLGVVMVFVMWVWHNLPDKTDLKWFAQAGGIVGKNHPPAKKFNAGQKLIFWSVIVFGGSISVSGLSLLFPYDLPMFAKTFAILNDIGVYNWIGTGPFPVELSPQEEMQYAQLWHAIVAFVLMAIIIAHIYIGSIGMEGAFDAMGTGEVDEAWAHQHHSLWLDELKEKNEAHAAPPTSATPAE